jgi:DNA-binding Xre family transcriptional regulator
MRELNHLRAGHFDFVELDPIAAGCEDLECIRLI